VRADCAASGRMGRLGFALRSEPWKNRSSTCLRDPRRVPNPTRQSRFRAVFGLRCHGSSSRAAQDAPPVRTPFDERRPCTRGYGAAMRVPSDRGRSEHAVSTRSRNASGAIHHREFVPRDHAIGEATNEHMRCMPRRVSMELAPTRGGSERVRAERAFPACGAGRDPRAGASRHPRAHRSHGVGTCHKPRRLSSSGSKRHSGRLRSPWRAHPVPRWIGRRDFRLSCGRTRRARCSRSRIHRDTWRCKRSDLDLVPEERPLRAHPSSPNKCA
jgi:hypothetical protein